MPPHPQRTTTASDAPSPQTRWHRILAVLARATRPLRTLLAHAGELATAPESFWWTPASETPAASTVGEAVREEVARLRKLVDHYDAGRMSVVYVVRGAGTQRWRIAPGRTQVLLP